MKHMFYLNSVAFFMVQQMSAIWSLVPLPFIIPACISGSSWLTYCWSLLHRILSIILLPLRLVQLYSNLNILWHCLSLGLEWRLTFSNPVATAELSKFAGILSAALPQHHLSGFSSGKSIQAEKCPTGWEEYLINFVFYYIFESSLSEAEWKGL